MVTFDMFMNNYKPLTCKMINVYTNNKTIHFGLQIKYVNQIINLSKESFIKIYNLHSNHIMNRLIQILISDHESLYEG